MEYVQKKAQELMARFATENPWELAASLEITVIKYPLKNLKGIYFSLKGNRFAAINSRLSFDEQTTTLAHEIGHAILHPTTNYFSITNSGELLDSLKAKQNCSLH